MVIDPKREREMYRYLFWMLIFAFKAAGFFVMTGVESIEGTVVEFWFYGLTAVALIFAFLCLRQVEKRL